MQAPDPPFVPFRARRESGDPPARRRRVRKSALARRLLGALPAPQNESGNAGTFGRELQAAAPEEVEPPDLARYGGDPGSAQPLLHRPQEAIVAPRLDEKEAGGIEPEGIKARAIKIGRGEAPQNAAAFGRKTPQSESGKGGGKRAVLLLGARAEDLVQSPSREPASRQGAIDCRKAKGDDPVRASRRPLDLPHILAKP